MAYVNLAELSDRFPSLDDKSPQARSVELDTASAWVDDYTGRTFTVPTATSVLYFASPENRYVLDLGRFEIGTNDSVVVATDDGSGAYATTLVEGTDYQLEPVNAPYESRPYTQVRALNTYWPRSYNPAARQERIKITAKYGWPTVPQPIKTATMLLVVAAFENASGVRSESIDGYSVTYLAGDGSTLGVPNNVIALLAPYRQGWAV